MNCRALMMSPFGGQAAQPRDRIRIVLVDDDALTRGGLRWALDANVFEVVGEAGTGRTGLEVCLRTRPDIIFLDVAMPDMDGLEILPALRRELPMSQILMVTASDDRVTIETAIMGGASGYVIKPLSVGKVDQALQRLVANLRRRRFDGES